MKYVDDLEELRKMVYEVEEPIVYPVKEEGMIFLDYFRYTNERFRWDLNWTRFLCIARESLPRGCAQRIIQNLPVIPLKYLIHFKDTATFFVAAPEEFTQETIQILEDFGCKNIVAVSDKIFFQMRNKLDDLKKSGHVMDWHLNYFTKKIEEFQYRIAEQSELCYTNTKAFEEYRNAFRGKKVVIVGGGPTIKCYKPMTDAIHIGLNWGWKEDNIPLDYLFTHDGMGQFLTNPKMEDGFDKIRKKIFVGKFLDKYGAISFPEKFSVMNDKLIRYFASNEGLAQQPYQDICHHPLMDFMTVAFSAIHFALFTYPKELYLVGCDTSRTRNIYYKTENNKYDLHTDFVKLGYARVKMFAELYYPDVEIISVNPIGLKGLFKDIYTDEYKNSSE